MLYMTQDSCVSRRPLFFQLSKFDVLGSSKSTLYTYSTNTARVRWTCVDFDADLYSIINQGINKYQQKPNNRALFLTSLHERFSGPKDTIIRHGTINRLLLARATRWIYYVNVDLRCVM